MMTSYLTPAPSTGGGLGLRAVLGFYSLQPAAGSLAWAADPGRLRAASAQTTATCSAARPLLMWGVHQPLVTWPCRAFELFSAYGLLLGQPSLCPVEHRPSWCGFASCPGLRCQAVHGWAAMRARGCWCQAFTRHLRLVSPP